MLAWLKGHGKDVCWLSSALDRFGRDAWGCPPHARARAIIRRSAVGQTALPALTKNAEPYGYAAQGAVTLEDTCDVRGSQQSAQMEQLLSWARCDRQ